MQHFLLRAINTLSDFNPYQTPNTNGTLNSGRKLQSLALQGLCTYGRFVNFWYFGAIVLYILVYGDQSSTFGLYPIIPAAIAAIALVWAFRNRTRTLYVLVVLTAPLGLFFAYNFVRFGLF